jgi:putative PEP-CTERM system TPR-repeat lipoprotein
MQAKNSSIAAVAAAALVVGLLSGCGDSPDKLLGSAKEYMAKQDYKAATIQLKNVLQKQPESGEARYLLGASLLAAGDVVAAEIELRKARDLKYADDQVTLKLANALLLQGQSKKLIDEFASAQLGSPAANAELLTSLANAYGAVGNADAAQQALNKALAADPQNVAALLLQARQMVVRGDADAAVKQVDALLQREPKNADAWRFKADVMQFAKRHPDEALAAYRKVIELQPNDPRGYFGSVGLLTRQGKLEDAEKDMVLLRKVAPRHPESIYLDTQLSFVKRDLDKARQQVQELLKVAPGNPRTQEIAGGIELQRNALVTAEEHLTKALQAEPRLTMARRWLVTTYLRSGQPAKAQTTIASVVDDKTVDPALLSLAGEVQLMNGDAARAEGFFARASKLDPSDGRKRTALAMTQMAGGQIEAGLEQLQDIAATDKGTSADMALISTLMRRREMDKALQAIDRLETKTPNSPVTGQLRGRVLLAKNDVAGARRSFEASLVPNPNYFASIASLAALDIADKKPEQARKRFEDLLAREPKNARAMVALAELQGNEPGDHKARIVDLLTRAIGADATEVAPRVKLVDYLLAQKDATQALTVAQQGAAALPTSLPMIDALGRAQMAAGDLNQGTTTLARAASLQPQAPAPWVRLADAQMAAKNSAAAEQSLRRALDAQPNFVEAQQRMVALRLDQNRLQDAVALARTVQKQRPGEAVGFILEGDARMSKKDADGALAAYQAGLKAVPSPELMVRQLAVLHSAGKSAEADRQAAAWMQRQPKDVAVPLFLADRALNTKRMAEAERLYLEVVKQQPNNALAYNNLAWVASELKRDAALDYAAKANALAPNQPAFMDTWAMLLADKQDFKQAIALQTKVLALQGQNPLFKLNMAKIYAKAGDKAQARQLVDELAKLGDKFGGQSEVEKLRASL